MQVQHKTFTQLRQQVAEEWAALPKKAAVIGQPLQDRIASVRRSKQH